MGAHYEVRIAEPVDEASLHALGDLGLPVVLDDPVVVVRGWMDQPTLHGLLERIRVLGLQLEEVRRLHCPPARRVTTAPSTPGR